MTRDSINATKLDDHKMTKSLDPERSSPSSNVSS